jgi:hypothetical protein
MRRELLPLFGIAALFGSLTTLSVVLAVDPIDYPYEISASPRSDKALIFTPPAPDQIKSVAFDSGELCARCSAKNSTYAAAEASDHSHCSNACDCPTACHCPATAAASSCDNANCRQPVVVDLPELLGPTDGSAIDVIKRKLGINVFAGTIYENSPPSPALPCASSAWHSDEIHYYPTPTANQLFPQHDARMYRLSVGIGVISDAGLLGDLDDDCPGSTPRDVAKTAYVAEEPECTECTVGIDALRNSSEDLDSAANHLERLERYEQADLIRSAAHELRHLARRLRHNGGHLPTVSVAPMPLGARFDVLSEDVRECTADPPPPIGQ